MPDTNIATLQSVYAPITQAARCLDAWLAEDGHSLSPRQRQRASALIARYFENEESVSDELILSFLRHYGGFGVVDLDDPQSVRQSLKDVLDRRQPRKDVYPLRILLAITMLCLTAIVMVYYLSLPITLAQQKELREAVASHAAEKQVSPVSVWADIKSNLGVRRYADIKRSYYDDALQMLGKKQGL